MVDLYHLIFLNKVKCERNSLEEERGVMRGLSTMVYNG
jgi:hypothetical protein